MKLWLLKREPYEAQRTPLYDVKNGAIVRAETEAEAREFVAARAWDEGRKLWLETASCVELIADGEPGIVLEDNNPG